MRQLSFTTILLGVYFSVQYVRNRFVLYKGTSCGYQINPVIKCLLNNNKAVSFITYPCYEPAITVLVVQPPNKHTCTPEPQQAATVADAYKLDCYCTELTHMLNGRTHFISHTVCFLI